MPSFEEVRAFLHEQGHRPLVFDQRTPDVESAAQAVGCTPAEIAKTLVVRVGDSPLVVVCSGDRRLNSALLKKAFGRRGKVRFPDPEEVERLCGYPPGAVSPFLLPDGMPVLIDLDLRRHELSYPAAGSDHSAVPLSWEELCRFSGGTPAEVCVPL